MSEGERTLPAEVHYFYDIENWECTYPKCEAWAIEGMLNEARHQTHDPVIEIATLIQGPKQFAAEIFVSGDETELRFFDSEDEARAARRASRRKFVID